MLIYWITSYEKEENFTGLMIMHSKDGMVPCAHQRVMPEETRKVKQNTKRVSNTQTVPETTTEMQNIILEII